MVAKGLSLAGGSEVRVSEDCENTDKEIWRKKAGDYYSPSIHVTQGGGIGINCGGHVIVMPVEKWHALGRLRIALQDINESI